MTYQEFFNPVQQKIDSIEPQRWVDLGCGDGLFTKLLAEALPFQSEILAIDKIFQRLNSVMGNEVSIKFKQNDFENNDLDLNHLDGILMANSFHYIKEKEKLINKLNSSFESKKQFLIVEYDTTNSNPWVPYPINFQKLKELFHKLDYESIEKLNVRNSTYGGEMYLAFIN